MIWSPFSVAVLFITKSRLCWITSLTCYTACLSSRVTLAFTGVGLLVFLTSLVGLLPNGRYD